MAQRDRLLLVQYETLASDPAKAIHAIYAFLGEPVFEHDFGQVDYDVTEFDERAGTPGLHTVRGTVEAEPRETLLPPDLFRRFVNDAFGGIRSGFPLGCGWCEVSSVVSEERDGGPAGDLSTPPPIPCPSNASKPPLLGVTRAVAPGGQSIPSTRMTAGEPVTSAG